MNRTRGRERMLSLLALVAAGTAAALSAYGAPIPAAICAATAAIAVGADFIVRRAADRPRREQAQIEKFVASGRKLVIYERDTGLFAHWYLELRGNEECDRAKRYARALALLVIEPAHGSDAWATQEALRVWLSKELRQSDIAGYLGNGRYVVVMPEADATASAQVIGRLKREGYAADIGLSCLPDDGETYEQLYQAAASQLPVALRRIA